MVNNQFVITDNIRKLLLSLSDFDKGGYFKDTRDFEVALGQNQKYFLIDDDDEQLYTNQENLSVIVEFPIDIYVYLNTSKNRQKTMTDLVANIHDALLDDSFLNTLRAAVTGTIHLVEWFKTDKGDYMDNFNFRTAGYTDDRMCWILSYYFNFSSAR